MQITISALNCTLQYLLSIAHYNTRCQLHITIPALNCTLQYLLSIAHYNICSQLHITISVLHFTLQYLLSNAYSHVDEKLNLSLPTPRQHICCINTEFHLFLTTALNYGQLQAPATLFPGKSPCNI
jgi:hypothetical protein